MAVYGKKKIKAAQKRKWRESCSNWHWLGQESLYGDVLITRVRRKPPMFRLEQHDVSGDIIKGYLIKAPQGMRGWSLHLGKDVAKVFRTKRRAIEFFARLQFVVSEEDGELST